MMRATPKVLKGIFLGTWGGKVTNLLTVIVALMLATLTPALAATGGNFILGRVNSATTFSRLSANVAGPAMQLFNTSTAANARALDLVVDAGNPPMTVNSTAGKALNLDADKVDGQSFSCPSGTLFHEGVCIETAKRAYQTFYPAQRACLDEGKRLPTIAELQTFRNRSGQDFKYSGSGEWTSHLDHQGSTEEAAVVFPDGVASWATTYVSNEWYRCVVPPS